MVRWQAARHSGLLMCVALSQKPMQSASDLPPPPGALGADSLGLAELPGERARLLCAGTPPPEICVDSCGDSGAMAGAWAAGGWSVAGPPVEVEAAGGGAGGVVVSTVPLWVDDEVGPVGCVGGDGDPRFIGLTTPALPAASVLLLPPIAGAACKPPPPGRANVG